MDTFLHYLGVKPRRNYNLSLRTALTLAALVTLTQLGDFLSTYIAITNGLGQEGNPLMASVINNYGMLGFFFAKLLSIVLLLWLSWRRRGASLAYTAIYIAVVTWNTYITLKGL